MRHDVYSMAHFSLLRFLNYLMQNLFFLCASESFSRTRSYCSSETVSVDLDSYRLSRTMNMARKSVSREVIQAILLSARNYLSWIPRIRLVLQKRVSNLSSADFAALLSPGGKNEGTQENQIYARLISILHA